jgi:hypothetical protein
VFDEAETSEKEKLGLIRETSMRIQRLLKTMLFTPWLILLPATANVAVADDRLPNCGRLLGDF